MQEATIHLFVKIFLLITAFFGGVFQSVTTVVDSGDVIDRAFDYSFSVGVMALFIVYMVFENWAKDKKKDTAQNRLTDLLSKNIEAINDFSGTNKDIAKTLERMDSAQSAAIERSANIQSEALNNLTRAFEKLEAKL